MKNETEILTCVCGHSSKSHRKGDSIQNTPCDECWNAVGVEKPCSEFRVRHTPTEPPAVPVAVRDELNDLEVLAKKWIAEHPCSFVVLEQKDGSTESETEYHTRLIVAFGYAATKSLRTELAEAVRERDAYKWALESISGAWDADYMIRRANEALDDVNKQSGGDGGTE